MYEIGAYNEDYCCRNYIHGDIKYLYTTCTDGI